jgi:hypothetical protein
MLVGRRVPAHFRILISSGGRSLGGTSKELDVGGWARSREERDRLWRDGRSAAWRERGRSVHSMPARVAGECQRLSTDAPETLIAGRTSSARRREAAVGLQARPPVERRVGEDGALALRRNLSRRWRSASSAAREHQPTSDYEQRARSTANARPAHEDLHSGTLIIPTLASRTRDLLRHVVHVAERRLTGWLQRSALAATQRAAPRVDRRA